MAIAPPRPKDFTTIDLTACRTVDLQSVEQRREVWDELQAVFVLQGIVNRKAPRLYALFVGDGGFIDRHWMRWLQSPGEWLEGVPAKPLSGLDEALKVFGNEVKGAIVWDEGVPATSNVANTLAAVKNALPVRYDPRPGSLYDRLVNKGPKLKVLVNLVGKFKSKAEAYRWAIASLVKNGSCSDRFMAYYPDAHWIRDPKGVPPERTLASNYDFFIAKKAFFFDLGPWDDDRPDDEPDQPLGEDFRTLTALLHAMHQRTKGRPIHVGGFTPWDQKYTDFTGRKHGGVESEWRYAEILSCFNAFMDADAAGLHAMANASFFAHYPLKAKYPQRNLPTLASLEAKGYIKGGKVAPKRYVAIYVGDYDSAAWLYQMLPHVWDDPARGSIPLGWAFNPVLQERFPVGLAYARKTASPMDTFVMGDSGIGYLNPGYLEPPRKWSGLTSGLARWEAFSKPYIDRWDLRVTGFVIDGFAPPMSQAVKEAYARMSPAGVVAQKVPPVSLVNGVPFLRMGADLDRDRVDEAAALIAREGQGPGPTFRIYRTILWPASKHKQLFEKARALNPDIEFVEPHALFLLIKTALGGKL